MGKITTFQELNLSSAFLFAAALSDEEISRRSLEIMLGHPVGKVKVHAENVMTFRPDSHGIRLDVYLVDEKLQQYDIEMQQVNKGDLPKRSRYYQSKIDLMFLKPGVPYAELPPVYIIFLCGFDPFGHKKYRYSFENTCKETGMPLGDGAHRIFLNCKGENSEEVTPELIHFLKYIEQSTAECAREMQDAFVDQLHLKVTQIRRDSDLEARYMLLEELLQERKEEGIREGRKEGQACMIEIMRRMVEAGLQDELPRLVEDETFRDQMVERFGQEL